MLLQSYRIQDHLRRPVKAAGNEFRYCCQPVQKFYCTCFQLEIYLTPEEDEEFIASDGKLEVVETKEEPKTNYSLSSKPAAKKSKSDQFDDLFEDDDVPF